MDTEKQKPELRRLDDLNDGSWFRLDCRLFIRGHETMWAKDGFVLVCWDYANKVHIGLGIDEMVEPIDAQAVIDIAFGRIDTVVGNIQMELKESFRGGVTPAHAMAIRRLHTHTERLKSHLADLQTYLRDKKPPPILWSNTMPFDTEGKG